MSQLLDCIVEDLKNGKIKIISREIVYAKSKRGDSFVQTNFLAQHENGSTTRLSKKTRKMYEEVLSTNK